jgi:hypothetical protein
MPEGPEGRLAPLRLDPAGPDRSRIFYLAGGYRCILAPAGRFTFGSWLNVTEGASVGVVTHLTEAQRVHGLTHVIAPTAEHLHSEAGSPERTKAYGA